LSGVKLKSGFFVPNQDDKQELAEVDRLNAELTRSLLRCRKLLFDFRSDLAANTKIPELLDDPSEATGARP